MPQSLLPNPCHADRLPPDIGAEQIGRIRHAALHLPEDKEIRCFGIIRGRFAADFRVRRELPTALVAPATVCRMACGAVALNATMGNPAVPRA